MNISKIKLKIFQTTNNLTLPVTMTSEMVKSAWANIGFFLHHLDPEIQRIVRRLEHLHLKIIKKKQSVVFNRTSLSLYIYIYIRGAFNKFPDILYRHLKLSQTLENSVCYCYASYEMTDQFL